MPRVYLVDASPYIFRAFFSIPPSVTTPQGQPANAVYGFGGFLLKLLVDENVSHMALAFDRSLTTSFRNEIYPAYKAQRELPPEDLEAQLTGCEELAGALGIATFSSQRYEAEDLLGSLLDPLLEAGQTGDDDADGTATEIVLVTADKDLMQLVDDRVSLFDLARDERYGPAEVMAKFGVRPEQIADFLALAGDSVDNIPGIPGIGRKTAAVLLSHVATLDALLEHPERVAELPIRGARSLSTKLRDHADLARVSKRLAVIARDAPVTATLQELRVRGPQLDRFEPLVEHWGFGGFAERVRDWAETLKEGAA